MRQIFMASLAFLSMNFAQARLLVISDIDDTIKISHVRGKTRGFANAFRTQNVFPGISRLYQEIRNRNPEAEFYYISNAPETLMRRSHKQFLDDNKFPSGALEVRDSLQNKNFKFNTIRSLLKRRTPEVLILFGDTAEKDPEIYAKIKEEFPRIRQYSFIRHLNAPFEKEKEQEPASSHFRFVSPIEVSLELKQLGFLTEPQVRDIEVSLTSDLKTSLSGAEPQLPLFPSWIQCQDYQTPDHVKNRNTQESQLLAKAIELHCH